MNETSESKLDQLKISPGAKRRSSGAIWLIFVVVVAVLVVAVAIWRPWEAEKSRVMVDGRSVTRTELKGSSNLATVGPRTLGGLGTNAPTTPTSGGATAPADDSVLTVSGYIIVRERIELSPRFMGLVTWIGVKKGDVVTNGQVVVLLDESEYRARLAEQEGRLASARVGLEKAEHAYQRTLKLAHEHIESPQLEDDARLGVEAARAAVREIEGQIAQTQTYLGWCTIRSPINGVVLEKLVDPNELVSPQSFGGTRGPSTALIAVADTGDLQVEIDLNESDLAKISLNQKGRVTPEAYPDRHYEGVVAEIAPEASRQKGTLQIKVQIKNPDRYLTPELSARVDFLKPA